MNRFSMPVPDDFHVHLRRGGMLHTVLPHTTGMFGRALVMPNTIPAIVTAEDVRRYRREIMAASPERFIPLMTIKLLNGRTTPEVVLQAREEGAVAAKLYPVGVTTNAEDGVRDAEALAPVFGAMESAGMVLCLHGEKPDTFCLEREAAFLPALVAIAGAFPNLKIVLEHVTTAAAVDTVAGLTSNVAATITAHHLLLTLDDVVGGALNPHAFCKPVPKTPSDREALWRVIEDGNPKFFLGTDSAPHPISSKECPAGCAGIFAAPVAMPALVTAFDRRSLLKRLPDFAARFGADFYGLQQNEGEAVFVRRPWTVPSRYKDVVPFLAGTQIEWSFLR